MKTPSKEIAFREACADNSIEELIEGLTARRADAIDCKTWGITPTQWRRAIAWALKEKVQVRK